MTLSFSKQNWNFKRLFREQTNAFFITGCISLMAEPGIRRWEMWDFISLLIRLHLTGGYLSYLDFFSQKHSQKGWKNNWARRPCPNFYLSHRIKEGQEETRVILPKLSQKELSKLKVIREKNTWIKVKSQIKITRPFNTVSHFKTERGTSLETL